VSTGAHEQRSQRGGSRAVVTGCVNGYGDRMHFFVVPPKGSAITGGNLYNEFLLQALAVRSFSCDRLGVNDARKLIAANARDIFWLDTLYLEDFAGLRQANRSAKLGVLTHYLPTLGRTLVALPELSATERTAIDEAFAFIATSRYMADVLRTLGAANRPILVVEPGRVEQAPTSRRGIDGGVRAILVANLVEAKGIWGFLQALAGLLRPDDTFQLALVGSAALEPMYAERCSEIVGNSPALRARVTFVGALSHSMMLDLIADSNLFVSTSKMESFGMALAEARDAGIPIVARSGGNVSAHVDVAAGGSLCHSENDVASECVALARDPTEHRRRLHSARSASIRRYLWADAAASFIAQAEGLLV
jgi:glycosyltransferase involved in cell wall biosynthesis